MPDMAAEVGQIVERVRPSLAGRSPEVQGAVLADLLAMWLAGHIVKDDPAGTDALREELLEMHLRTVRKLIPVNAATIHGGS